MKAKLDYFLVIIVLVLFCLGLLNIYSASFHFSTKFVIKQLFWFFVSLVIGTLFYIMGSRRLLHLSLLFYLLGIALLILVLILPAPGAKRWIRLGFFNIQPSQLMKLALPALLVALFNDWEFKSVRSFLYPLLLTLIPSLLIAKEPDLGGALLLLPALISFFILKRASIKKALPWITLGLIALPFLYQHLEPYQKKRLLVFINPKLDPLGAGYTLLQSKIAVGSGRIFGKGWLKGVQGQLRFLPESHTDFVFPVFAEEWGFLGCMMLLGLYFLLLMRLNLIAANVKEPDVRNFLYMLLVTLSFQIIINIGMTIGILPIVGLPLPLFSYGGSDLAFTISIIALFLRETKG